MKFSFFLKKNMFVPAGVGVRSPLLQHQPYDEQLRDIAASLTRPRSRRALPVTLERPTRLPPPDRLPVSTLSLPIDSQQLLTSSLSYTNFG